MKKFERAFVVFCITSLPCFILAAVFFLLAKDEVGYAVMLMGFILFLVYVCSRFWETLAYHFRKMDMRKKKDSTGREEEKKGEWESCINHINELRRNSRQLHEKINQQEFDLKERDEKRDRELKELKREVEELKRLCGLKARTINPISTSIPKNKPEEFKVHCRFGELERKRKLVPGEEFVLNRNGNGAYILRDYKLLLPDGIMVGKEMTFSIYEQFKSRQMENLYDIASTNIVNHKIINIIPAEIQILGNRAEWEFKGRLMRKGKIELDNLE